MQSQILKHLPQQMQSYIGQNSLFVKKKTLVKTLNPDFLEIVRVGVVKESLRRVAGNRQCLPGARCSFPGAVRPTSPSCGNHFKMVKEEILTLSLALTMPYIFLHRTRPKI